MIENCRNLFWIWIDKYSIILWLIKLQNNLKVKIRAWCKTLFDYQVNILTSRFKNEKMFYVHNAHIRFSTFINIHLLSIGSSSLCSSSSHHRTFEKQKSPSNKFGNINWWLSELPFPIDRLSYIINCKFRGKLWISPIILLLFMLPDSVILGKLEIIFNKFSWDEYI